MKYVSTRGSTPEQAFEGVLLSGLARDGGLFVPGAWPAMDPAAIASLDGLAYPQIVARVVRPFIEETLVSDDDLARITEEAYAGFRHPAIAPLRQIDADTWLLELFHGPTLAFKDFALQMLGGLFDHVLGLRGERLTIVGATSGDTGSAAIEACRDRDNLDIFMLYPEGRVSEVQRRQMTTVDAANVYNIEVRGTFDDCQDLVKAMFADDGLRDEFGLSAVNSINWARVMGQTAYYFAAAARLGAPGREFSFVVPTGNFGNVYSAYVAREMGLPVSHLVVAANRNDILYRFFDRGDMSISGVEPSLSPSMDIQVSSNFERLMFDLMDRDGTAVADAMQAFRTDGVLPDGERLSTDSRDLFSAQRLDDDETLSEIRRVHEEAGMLVDPHTAVAIGAARKSPRDGTKRVVLATAHPAKFPDAVEQATGIRPGLPPHLSDLLDRPERAVTLDNDLSAVREHVRAHATPRRKD
ncbi:MAG: threonine synthase [Alphaproteobacteria bacterium]|nr:threonine synthase [Alphaproteobacteria bacterium]